MKVLVIASQKGGTGKTTTAAAIGCWAVGHGIRTVAVDLDPQGSLTQILGGNGDLPGAYEFMKGAPVDETVQTIEKMPDLIPASLQLAGAENEFSTRPGRDFLLGRALEAVGNRWELCVLDTPPTQGTLLINALTAADEVVIPLQADTFAVQALTQLLDTIGQVQKYCNQYLNIAGVLLTRFNQRTLLTREIAEDLKNRCASLGIKVFDPIREGIALKESQSGKKSLFAYASGSKPAQDYHAFITQLLAAK